MSYTFNGVEYDDAKENKEQKEYTYELPPHICATCAKNNLTCGVPVETNGANRCPGWRDRNVEALSAAINKQFEEEKKKAFENIGKKMKEELCNAVNHPSHYNDGGIECIEAMRILFGDEKVKAFCELNSFKYLWRAGKKGDAKEDIDKAKWYSEYRSMLEACI